MYKIGEFFKLCQLSVKTLRYYADIGLLKPAHQDVFTGYRYYSASQLQEAVRIQALKELGFTLDEIRESDCGFEQMVEKKEQMIRGRVEELERQLRRLETSKELWKKEDVLPEGFEEDTFVYGKWKVCDFVRNPADFRVGEYNAGFPKDKLYFRKIHFHEDGSCEAQYGEEILTAPDIDWTKGFVRERKSRLLQKYERQVIEGTEYLFVEFKSGDYYYNHQPPWWYVFTREAE